MYADELWRAVREAGEFEAVFITKVGPPHSKHRPHADTRFALAGDIPGLYHFYTSGTEFDRVMGSARSKRIYTEDWRGFLQAYRPDVVHFHHATWLGYDMIRETRRTLPAAAIVYTLHDFNPICHHNGQMVLKETLGLCDRSSPRRCHHCFPDVSAQKFFLRTNFVRSAFELVDMCIAPSDHARRRFIEWGLAPEKIVHQNYGRLPQTRLPDPPDAGRRGRLAFFGQITQFKGVDVLLEAMKILAPEQLDVQLLLYGANLEHQRTDVRGRIESLLEETADSVRFRGRYEQSQLPALLSDVDWVIVPSIWWETGPLVIHEALMHARPVICSDIGSMVERIDDGVNGLHFRVGDPTSLADAIRRAVGTPGLWSELQNGIAPPHSMEDHLPIITGIYNELLARREHPALV
ncbi:MAG: hypothetical protein QOE18_1261 [Chloroflexota bacterium]|nr:hypothetical protein [Chloroflexota bacterium]